MKLLVIVAHPDDAEFGVGGLCALYKKTGYDVRILSVSNGCCGHHVMSREQTRLMRKAEMQAVTRLLGVEYDVFDDVDDGAVIADLATRRKLIRYIRTYSPDLIITHRTNDYHADHRNVGLLVQDASYMLTVPNECADTPAMRTMPVIAFDDDTFSNPPFRADVVIDIDSVCETKCRALACHVSQVYEWLPYVECDPRPVPPADDPAARYAFLIGETVTAATTDEQVERMGNFGLHQRFARIAARFRDRLIEKYGERGKRVRFAEALEISEYGLALTPELREKLFPF